MTRPSNTLHIHQISGVVSTSWLKKGTTNLLLEKILRPLELEPTKFTNQVLARALEPLCLSNRQIRTNQIDQKSAPEIEEPEDARFSWQTQKLVKFAEYRSLLPREGT